MKVKKHGANMIIELDNTGELEKLTEINLDILVPPLKATKPRRQNIDGSNSLKPSPLQQAGANYRKQSPGGENLQPNSTRVEVHSVRANVKTKLL